MVAWQPRGLGPALSPLTTSGMALARPLLPRPRLASCDLVTRALRAGSWPSSVLCPRLRASSGASSASPATSGPPVSSPRAPRAESVHGSLGCSGSGLRRRLGHKFLSHQDQVSAGLAPGRPVPSWAGQRVPPLWVPSMAASVCPLSREEETAFLCRGGKV